ncbi:MAG: lipid-A-disaccharide synthase [Candidatus Eisenbacteria bacterium]|nr:lipid-A-disaccharide synthase [Candidatus Eisenbacteria bacterium]
MVEPVERRFLIVVGEASGDLHAARLVTALRALGPCRVRGVTGPALEAAGVERIESMDALSVIGFSAVLPRLPRLWRTFRRLIREHRSFRPHACILVDAPGFHFRLGPALKRRGARVFYYVAPQVWAWHAERAAQMSRWVDRLAVVFPFEEAIFRAAGVEATFVGHPLLDDLTPEVSEAQLRSELEIASHRPILGLLPGSRPSEIRQHLPTLTRAAGMLSRSRPDLAVVIAVGASPGDAKPGRGGPGVAQPARDPAGREPDDVGGGTQPNPAPCVAVGRTRAVQAYARACAVCSGTATLETALFGTPLAIVYRVGALNYAIARRVIRVERIGLPNIVAGADVAPELLQGDFTAERVATTLAPWLDDPAERQRASERLRVVRERLGGPGASARAARLAWEMAVR